MIDIHSHILPAVDDGATHMDETLSILRAAQEQGVRSIVATPHVTQIPDEAHKERLFETFHEVKKTACAEGLKIQITLGAEMMISTGLPRIAACNRFLTLDNTGRYLLMELPFIHVPVYTEQIFFELLLQKTIPVLAHPERYTAVQKDHGLLYRWIEKGILTQLSAGSLLGRYGAKAKATANALLRQGLVHIIASDVHSPKINDGYAMAEGTALAAAIVGKETVHQMVHEVPKKFLKASP